MSRSLGTLTLDLAVRTGMFVTGMGKAERELDKRAKAIEDRARKMGLALGVALAAAGTAAAAGIKSAIDYADKLNDMNQRLGVSAEALSGWGYAAKQTGTDIDALGVGLKKLAKNMAEALDPKSTQGRLFEGLGVSVTDAAGKLRTVEDVLPEVASKFKELDNATLESALAMDLFGKSGTDLIEFLNQGGDGLAQFRDRARELGVELDGNTLAAADAFNDGLADLQTAVDGLWTQVAADLLPDLLRLVDVFVNLTREGSETASTASKIADGFRVVGVVVESSASLISSLTQILGGFVQQAWGYYKVMAGILSLDMSTLKSGVGTIKASGKNISAGWDRFIDPHGVNALFKPANVGRYDGPLLAPSKTADAAAAAEAAASERKLARAYGPTDRGGKSRGKRPDVNREAEDAIREAKRAAEAQERWRGTVLDLEATLSGPLAVAEREYTRNTEQLTAAFNSGEVALADYAKGMDAYKAQRDAEIKTINDRKTPAQEMLADMQFEAELIGKTREEQELLNAARRLGADAATEQGKAALAAMNENQEALRAFGEQAAFMDGVRGEFNDFFMDVFTGTKSLKDAFADLFDGIAAMITQKIVSGWIDKLFGGPESSGAGTSGGNIFGSILGMFFGGKNANGNAFMGGRVVPFANGGVVTAPQFFPMSGGRTGLMGEAGPEAIMPLKRGPDGKLGVRMSGGGGTINQTINVPRGTEYRSAAQVGQAALMGAQRAVSRNR